MADYKKYYKGNEQILMELERLHTKKYELKRLIDSSGSIEPFVTEFSGLPRTGKSSSLDRVYEFFKQANISVEKTDEPAQIIKDSMTKEEVSKMTNLEFNNKTLEISKNELNRKKNQQPTIIIQDRGVIDNYFWYQMMYEEGQLSDEQYEQILISLSRDLMDVDQLFVMYAQPEIIIFRDYISQIWLEDRKKTTLERVTQLRNGFEHLIPLIRKEVSDDKLIQLDTSNIGEIQTAITIADTMMNGINKKLILKRNNNNNNSHHN